ncbi:MAG: hypothetical protein AB7S92_21635 [Parvibaculaceae bacterium]
MKYSKLFGCIASKYEALFLRQLTLENECDCAVPHAEPIPRRRFSIAGAIFPTEAAWPRYQY